MGEQDDIHSLEINDPLLGCLVIITQLFHKPASAFALRAGLPINNELISPQLFVQAAERVDISAKIVQRPLTEIPDIVLPSVLILKNNQACILHKINPDNTVEIIFPEHPEGKSKKTVEELEKIYSGYVIFVQPIFHAGEHAKYRDQEEEKVHFSSWFWGTLWHYKRSYGNVLLASLLINIFTLVTSLFVMNVYDRVVPTFAVTTLWVLATGIGIVYIFDFMLRTLRNYVMDIVGKKSDILMGNQLFHRVIGMQLASKPVSVGAFTNRMMEFEVIRDFFTSITLTSLVDWPFMILYLLFIAYIGGVIVFVPLVIIPIVIGVMLWLEIPMRKLMKETVENNSKKNAVLIESLSGLETIKGLVAEGMVQQKWENFSSRAAISSQKSRFLWTIGVNTTNFAQQIVSAAVVIVGVYMISDGLLTLGGLIACTILASRAIAPLGQIANVLTRLQRAKMALKNLNQIMETPSERVGRKHYIYRPQLKGDIEFQNVSFSYPTPQGDQIQVLTNISFKMKGGEHLALLGHMGSGKTTLQKLMLGFYQPDSGAIYLDGVDIKQIDPVDLRRYISYIPQNNILLSGSVRENIMIGCPWATEQAFLKAAMLAGVDKIVAHHPSGYDCFVGERGETLSGGQRQAIVIARALISDGSLFLMDEPTSSTDAQTEVILIHRLNTFLAHKTLLLTTHRVSLLALVSRVLLLQNGRLVMDGPRDDVLKKIKEMAAPPEEPRP